jgi:predicted nucleic-acid-binding Zn-ribbon protein
MKISGKCPKCGSQDIVNPSPRRLQTKIGVIMVDVLYLVCTDCGYYEEYVDNDSQLQKWKNQYLSQ